MNDPDQILRQAAWFKFRRDFLMQHPVCAVPGCGRLATCVDHIKRRSAGGAVFDPANCEALCETHHNRKTRVHDQRHQTGKYEHRLEGCDQDGIPLDSRHHWHKSR